MSCPCTLVTSRVWFAAWFLIGLASVVSAEDEKGFKPLFNGKTLDGWFGAVKRYEVKDGAIASKPKCRGTLFAKGEYKDFVLRLEFRLTPGANNGIALRAPRKGRLSRVGMECQVLDNSAEKNRKIKPYRTHGSLYAVAPAKRGALKPVGEWNQQEISCIGRHVRVELNGKVILDVNLDDCAPHGRGLDGLTHPGVKREKGLIGFIGHDDRVFFRNIRIKVVVKS